MSPAHLDWLHGVLLALLPVALGFGWRAGKAVGTRVAKVLRDDGHTLAAQLLEAVIAGVEEAGDDTTKAAVQAIAQQRGLEPALAPIVERVTSAPPASPTTSSDGKTAP